MQDHVFYRITLGYELPRNVGRHDPMKMRDLLRRLSELFAATFGRRNLDYWFHQFPKVISLPPPGASAPSTVRRILHAELNAAAASRSDRDGVSEYCVGTRMLSLPSNGQSLAALSEDGLPGKRCEDCGKDCWRETETFAVERRAAGGLKYDPWLVFANDTEIKGVFPCVDPAKHPQGCEEREAATGRLEELRNLAITVRIEHDCDCDAP